MISALLVKEDFVLITAGNSTPVARASSLWPEGGQNSRAVSVDWVEAAVDRLLKMFLGRFICRGSFTVTTARGKTYTFGDGSGSPVAVRFATPEAQRAVLFDPELKIGETYMDGTFVVEQGSIADVLQILLGQERMEAPAWASPFRWMRYLLKRLQQFNLRS